MDFSVLFYLHFLGAFYLPIFFFNKDLNLMLVCVCVLERERSCPCMYLDAHMPCMHEEARGQLGRTVPLLTSVLGIEFSFKGLGTSICGC